MAIRINSMGLVNKIPVYGLILTLLMMGVFSSDAWSVSETEQYFDRIKVFNEVLSEIQLKYVYEDKVKTEELIRNAIDGMLKSLDPHSAYMPPQGYDKFKEDTRGTFGGLGITIDIRDGWLTVVSPLPETPAFREGILAGDKIVKIEGESTEGIELEEAVRQLRGEPGSQVTVTIFRPSDQSTVDHTMTRDIIRVPNVYAYVIDDSIGYIRLMEFKQTAGSDLDRAISKLEERKVEGLILDLRFNSGGLLDQAVEVSDKFLPKGKRVVSIRGRGEGQEREHPLVSRNKPRTELPLVVLVNQASASASEIVAGAIQDWHRGIIVGPAGQRTFGKGSVQTVVPLSDDSALKLTTAMYYTPSGRSIEGEKGIAPDIQVDVDEAFQRKLITSGGLGKLPESMAKIQQLLPEGMEMQPLQAEVKTPEVESATPEPSYLRPNRPDLQPKSETAEQEIYDKELAKAVEILKTLKILAMADTLFK